MLYPGHALQAPPPPWCTDLRHLHRVRAYFAGACLGYALQFHCSLGAPAGHVCPPALMHFAHFTRINMRFSSGSHKSPCPAESRPFLGLFGRSGTDPLVCRIKPLVQGICAAGICPFPGLFTPAPAPWLCALFGIRQTRMPPFIGRLSGAAASQKTACMCKHALMPTRAASTALRHVPYFPLIIYIGSMRENLSLFSEKT